MLQAPIRLIKNLLKGKILIVGSSAVLVLIGLAYFVIENRRKLQEPNTLMAETKEPVAQTSGVEAFFVVDVSGAVKNPGVYKVSEDSRIGDVVREAGGVSSEASIQFITKNINFAQRVEDSQKIYIPFEWETYQEADYNLVSLVIEQTLKNNPSSSSTVSASQPQQSSQNTGSGPSSSNTVVTGSNVNVNKASLSELDSLSGIGPSYAQRIIDNRNYKDFDELVSKSKVPKSTLEKIKNDLSF